MKLVIVGGVAAGASAAARARRLNEQADIIILERGEYISFANCGLPYHVGGDIRKRDDLLIVTPEHMRENFNIDVRTGNEAIAIDRERKLLTVRNLETGGEYRQAYDKLLLCQGSAPVTPPLPGIDHPRLFTLRNIPDMDAIKQLVDDGAQRAVVIGANYIGLEMVEAFRGRGMDVDLVEMQRQVMPSLDLEMASDLQRHLESHDINIHFDAIAETFDDDPHGIMVTLSNGTKLAAGLAVLAIGVRPETGMAADAGLEIGISGGVRVDQHLRTSDPDIYAAGDMVQVSHTVTGEPSLIPLAGPANRQGRIAANHIMGRNSTYASTQGTAILKVFEMTAAATGASEKHLNYHDIPYRKIYLHPYGHAPYYPGTASMHLKLLFSPGEGNILGAQIVGYDGVDKRIDVLATALRAGITVFDLRDLELAYAPPYSSAKDPVNMAGFVAANMLRGDVEFWYAEDYPEKTADGVIIDVRSRKEFSRWHIEGAVNIPLHELRSRLDEVRELAGDRPIYLNCLVGIRSYNAYRILHLNGFKHIFNLAGGRKTFESVHR
ncbi:coenzyme A disulfide reductase [bacterium BMS3Abin01]|nr:coenzyme A disulfide reductase [bacterium BMS3Abin01]HDZ59802.1 CoA-disulfide reductase [Actinomycetota bacterium]